MQPILAQRMPYIPSSKQILDIKHYETPCLNREQDLNSSGSSHSGVWSLVGGTGTGWGVTSGSADSPDCDCEVTTSFLRD